MRIRSGLFAGLLIGLASAFILPELVLAGGCPDGGKLEEHVVADGQTLSHVAVKYGVSQKSIERANPGLNPNLVRPGQKLKVCLPSESGKSSSSGSSSSSSKAKTSDGRSCGSGKTTKVHVVEKGDTLSGIAADYDVGVSTITSSNKKLKQDPNSLAIGDELLICLSSAQAHKAKNSKLCGYHTPLHEHVVLPGEHLGEIAGRYGVRRKDLLALNRSLSNANLLSVGQKIRVCPEIAPRELVKLEHTVESGETLSEIAAKYDLTTKELLGYQRGKLKDANDLRVGQALTVYKEGGVLPGFGGVDDDTGVLTAGVQLPGGKHYVVKAPGNAWGTGDTIRLIQTAISNYRKKYSSAPKVHVGDISKKGGGKFPPHQSHQHGRDVDIGYVLEGEQAEETKFISASEKNLDVARTWALLDAFLDTDQIKYIFVDYGIQKLLYEYAEKQGVSDETLDELFQYPRGKGRGHGIIRHSKGHVNHFHVRFR
ncbi:MAG: LysM peptidoglycan-binding domain-containing protein [Deltaproteobacteria bacterium]|nr:LysM peptidoglycan-binding domain-containing protein [Deltaproteobacteria bacterium]